MIPALHVFTKIGVLIARNIAQIYLSRRTKIRTRKSGHGVECDQSSIERRFEDATFAHFTGGGQWIEPSSHAPIDQTVSIVEALVDLRIVGPELFSGRSDQERSRD